MTDTFLPQHSTIMGKRDFYVDDDLVVTKPGVNTGISPELKEQEGPHGNVSFIEGMSIRTTPILEKYTSQARTWLHDKWLIYGSELSTQKSAIVNEYRSIANDVSLLVKEPVLPNLIYILTSTLTGSILVNRRSLPLRFLSPVLFGTVATSYFMPHTFETLTGKLDRYEKETVPEVYDAHQDLLKKYEQLKKDSEAGVEDLLVKLTNGVHDARVRILEYFDEKKK